jgi:hypothetical protein
MEVQTMSAKLKLGPKAKVIKLEDRLAYKDKSVAKLVDELGEINEERKRLENREAALKTELYSYGPGVYSGKVFDAMSTEMKRTFYKTELLMTHVSQDVLKKCEVVSPYLKVTLQRKSI